jgi:hypothetical protein
MHSRIHAKCGVLHTHTPYMLTDTYIKYSDRRQAGAPETAPIEPPSTVCHRLSCAAVTLSNVLKLAMKLLRIAELS